MTLFSDADGTLEAVLDFHLVTRWKTAGDSLLAARRLARPDAAEVLIVGAGTVAASLREAYDALLPEARFRVWNRTPERAEALAARHERTEVATDLAEAVAAADIVTVATMSAEPVIRGEWLRPGTHLDLIGAYRPDMREADDAAITAGRLFLDSRETVMGHIGELRDPLERGVLTEGGRRGRPLRARPLPARLARRDHRLQERRRRPSRPDDGEAHPGAMGGVRKDSIMARFDLPRLVVSCPKCPQLEPVCLRCLSTK